MRIVNVGVRRWLSAFVLLVITALALLAAAVAADPGSREDPLVTLSYARALSQLQLRQIPVSQTLTLPAGGELVIISPDTQPVNAAGFSVDKNVLINLTTGKRVIVTALQANQHYVNAGPGELALRFDAQVSALVRGAAQ